MQDEQNNLAGAVVGSYNCANVQLNSPIVEADPIETLLPTFTQGFSRNRIRHYVRHVSFADAVAPRRLSELDPHLKSLH